MPWHITDFWASRYIYMDTDLHKMPTFCCTGILFENQTFIQFWRFFFLIWKSKACMDGEPHGMWLVIFHIKIYYYFLQCHEIHTCQDKDQFNIPLIWSAEINGIIVLFLYLNYKATPLQWKENMVYYWIISGTIRKDLQDIS